MVGQVCFADSGRCSTPTPTWTHTPSQTPRDTNTVPVPTRTPTVTPTFYVDYYKCYVGDGPNRDYQVTLDDSFEGEKQHRVLTRETSICTPARRDGSRVAAPDNYLTCYELHDAAGEENFGSARQSVQTELDPNPAQQVTVIEARRPDRICVPSRLR